jgi:hypothetical protein
MSSALPILSLIALALVPLAVIRLVAIIPLRRIEAGGMTVGNPLHQAPYTDAIGVAWPLVSLSRRYGNGEMEGLLLGLRHLPIEDTAPLLGRYVRCSDPALQLYAQSILAQGRDQLHSTLVHLERSPPDDARAASWLLETGLRLAHPSLTGAAERPGLLHSLARQATERLATCEHTPSLLANAVRVFLSIGRAGDAHVLVEELPEDSLLRAALAPAVAHELHLQRLARS